MSDIAPLVRDHAAEFHGIQGWPATPKLVPTVIVCESQFPMSVLVLEPVKNGLLRGTVLAIHMVGCSALIEQHVPDAPGLQSPLLHEMLRQRGVLQLSIRTVLEGL